MIVNCIFDWCAAGNLIVGAILGIFGTVLVNVLAKCIFKSDLRKKFGKADGTYKGYKYRPQARDAENGLCEYKIEQAIESRLLDETQISEARITYQKDNILSIKVKTFRDGSTTEVASVWKGTMTMQVSDSGTIVWRYVEPTNDNISLVSRDALCEKNIVRSTFI